MMRSLERLLLIWVLGALSLGALLLVLASYIVTLEEMDEVFDGNLRQVALSLVLQPPPGAVEEQARRSVVLPPAYEEAGVFDFTTVMWDRDGHRLSASEPSVDLPFSAVNGISRIGTGDNAWHIYSIVTPDRVVQAAQRAASRRILAAHAASKLLLPMALLILAIGGLLVVALRGGLRSLDATARDLAARSAGTLNPIDAKAVPLEIQPLADSINGLMQRLAEAFGAQRRFVADAAHELRSPITALRLQLQNLERAQDAKQQAAAVGELRLGIERSQRMIVQLLDLSRLEPDVPALNHGLVELAALAQAVVVEYNGEALQKQIDLGAEAPCEVWVKGDLEQIQILMRNLVANAVRYTPPAGRVDVRTRVECDVPVFEVQDNGPGIAAKERERVFDRFYRGEAGFAATDVSGSGLGLAIVRAIAERHGAGILLLDSSAANAAGLRVQVRFGAFHPTTS
ncbi:sensor histidine kinase [Variovorax sp. RT4R15]|uniref:sensor histidine kinase n=1 Tax=Variovorax sp. RT4R15 TaxID=3443737 RepID=UPI003F4611D2